MIPIDQASALRGKQLTGADGAQLGTVDAVYVDDGETQATFATVRTDGSDGVTFVPLDEAELDGDTVAVPYDRDLVAGAPQLDPDGELSPEQEEELYAHYGLEIVDDDGVEPDEDEQTATPAAVASTDDVTELTRSEERLRIGTRTVPAGRVRLRKHVVTEMETVQVPVKKERLVLEREPIATGEADGEAPAGGVALEEAEHEIVLSEERVVVTKETVPVERVRIGKEVVTDDVTVTEEVRKEQVEADGDGQP